MNSFSIYLHVESNDERANIHIITGITNGIRLSAEKMLCGDEILNHKADNE